MTFRVDFKFQGIDDVEGALRQLGGEATRRVLRKATMMAAGQVAKQAKVLVPVDVHGNLKKAIKARQPKKKRPHTITAAAGVVGKYAPLTHLIEYGSGSFYTGSGQSRRGRYPIVPKPGGGLRVLKFDWGRLFRTVYFKRVMHPGIKPTHFLERALTMQKDAVVNILHTELVKGIGYEFGRFAGRARGKFAGNRK